MDKATDELLQSGGLLISTVYDRRVHTSVYTDIQVYTRVNTRDFQPLLV